nr:hypothetical protein [Tanacetum cinerariifolium]
WGDGDAVDWYDDAWCGECVKLTLSSTSLEKMVDIKQEVKNTNLMKTIKEAILEMARLSLATRKRKQKRQTLILAWWNQVTTIVIWYVYESDTMFISQIRMTQMCFVKLCNMLETLGGLKASKNMNIDDQVAIFLHIIAHNVKNRVMICRFYPSRETISRYFSRVCNAVIRLHSYFLKKPQPISEDSTDPRWKWFKNCLGALDGTYIRVLRDALDRPHGLKVPRPYCYLVDAGYTNGEGFLAPYRGQRQEMPVDPFETENEHDEGTGDVGCGGVGNINSIGTSNEWTAFRDNLAESIYDKPTKRISSVSRLKTMKQDWQVVYDMLNSTSGFGYDKGKNCVTNDSPGVWESYIKNHPKARKWRNKELPHYDELCDIFGKDRAQGKRANDAIEMENEAIKEQEQESEKDSDDAIDASVQVEASSVRRKKKKKNMRHVNPLVKSFNDAVLLFGERLKESSAQLKLGWLLKEIHETLAQLEKKRTRLRLYTNYLEQKHTVRGDGVANYKRRRQSYQVTASWNSRRRQNKADLKNFRRPLGHDGIRNIKRCRHACFPIYTNLFLGF